LLKGLGLTGFSSLISSSSSEVTLVLDGNPMDFKVLRTIFGSIGSRPDTSFKVVSELSFRFTRREGQKFVYSYTQTNRQYRPADHLTSWYELSNSPYLLNEIWSAGINETVSALNQTQIISAYESRNLPNISTQSFRGWINTRVIPSFEDIEFSLKGTTFGELAQTASQKVNRNQVNMIAFLRDLKNPKALVPKLKNLRKLKTHAGNYLGMQYGILPTIDDLKSIVAAFKARQPYLDRHGFKTYNAVHSDSKSQDDISLELEQRIKIAIEDEDNEFVEFANSVDSSGFAPTLENIWDLVPYSFVIDWFINIGDFLERVDICLRLSRLNIRYATMSQKSTKMKQIKASQVYPFVGTIQMVQYSRWTSDQCPVPSFFFHNTPTVSNHWLEASALIIQRTK
jgi:hypothetical protein